VPGKRPWREPRLSKKNVSEIAFGLFTGAAFSSDQVRETALLSSVFMPLMFVDSEQSVALAKHPPVLIVGWMKDTTSRSINGLPIFFSCTMVYKHDADLIRERIKKLQVASGKILSE